MRVVCDNCGASYRIPDHKLVKEINKATCRKCGESIIIRRSAGMSVGDKQVEVDPDAATQVTEAEALQAKESDTPPPVVASIPSGPSMGHGFGVPPAHLPEDAGPPTVAQQMDFKDETIPRQDLPESTAARPDLVHSQPLPPPPPLARSAERQSPAGPPSAALSNPPTMDRVPSQSHPVAAAQNPVGPSLSPQPRPNAKPSSSDEYSVEYTVVMMANFAAIVGAFFLVLADEPWQRSAGLFVCLAGAILSQGIVITSDRGRRPADMMLSYVFGFLIAGSAAAALHFFENKPDDQMTGARNPVVEARVNPGDSEPPIENADRAALGSEDLVGQEGTDSESEEASSGTSTEEPAADLPPEVKKEVVVEKTETPRSGVGRFPEDSKDTPAPSRTSSEDDFDDWDDPVDTPRRTKTPSSSSSKSSSSGSSGVSVGVLKTMLTSNRNVKKCFLSYAKETGSMPSGTIKVRLTIQPSGSTSKAYIKDGPYKGSPLDSCLSRAVTGISFPPFDSDKSKTYTYPFKL